jgi:dihydrofolate reductase
VNSRADVDLASGRSSPWVNGPLNPKERLMRKITITEFITLDGVVQDPGGAEKDVFPHGGWSFRFPDEGGGAYKLDELHAHDALLLGRATYDGFAKAWPDMTDEAGYADKFNAMPKYVVTSGDADELTWTNSTKIDGTGDVAAQVRALRDGDGGDIIVHGSCRLARFLIENDLVDELRLMVFPIALGEGRRLFADLAAPVTLQRTHLQSLDSGTFIVHYGRVASSAPR